MMHFIKLIRPLNLLIIIFTMYGSRFYIRWANSLNLVDDRPVDFLLLVLSTVLIAAAGNIINDYFDVKADRINKPEKLIITKHIARRWAIVSHWIINGIAYCIAIYLSVKYMSLWYVFVHLISINLLWFYSMLFKRKILIGNLIVSVLTGTIPLLVVIYYKVGFPTFLNYSNIEQDSWISIIDYSVLYLLGIFAFLQNMAREIVKDIQDVEGDKLIYVKSLPMKVGTTNSLRISALLLFAFPVFYSVLAIELFTKPIGNSSFFIATIPFLLVAVLNLIIIFLLLKDKNKRLKLYDMLMKIVMLIGVSGIYFLAYQHL